MKNTFKKVLSLLVAVMLILGSAFCITALGDGKSGVVEEDILTENFSGNALPTNWTASPAESWNFSTGAAVFTTDAATSAQGRLIYSAAGATAWSTYNLEADLTLGTASTTGSLTQDKNGKAYTRVVVATKSATSVDGVELDIIYNNKTAGWAWRVYDRLAAATLVSESDFPSSLSSALGLGKTLRVRIEKNGKRFAFYVNGVKLGEALAGSDYSGSIAFYGQNPFDTMKIDNVKVTESKAVGGRTEYLSDFAAGKYDSTAAVQEIYTIQKDASGAMMKAANMTTPYMNSQQNKGAQQFTLSNAPDGTSNVVRGAQGNLVYIVPDALKWKNYDASLSVAYKWKGGTNYASAADYVADEFNAGIAFAIDDLDSAPRNALLLGYDGTAEKYSYYLYLDGSVVSSGVIDQSLTFGQFVKLGVSLDGKTVKAYVQDTLVATCTASATLTGSVALRMNGVKSYAFFKDLTVMGDEIIEIDPDEPTPDDSTLLFDDFNKPNGEFAPVENTWTANSSALYSDRKLLLRNSSVYYTAAAASDWKNYVLTAQMILTDKNYDDESWDNSTDGDASSGVVVGAALKSSKYSGYEFTVTYDGNGFTAVLYDRANSKSLASNSSLSGLSINKPMVVKIDFKADKIDCYIDGTKVLTHDFASDDNVKGTVGLIGGSARTKFNYVHVVQDFAPEIDDGTPIVYYVKDDFNSYADGASPITVKKGWNADNESVTVKDKKIVIPDTLNTNLYARSSFKNGYVSADVSLDTVSANLTEGGTVYPLWLLGRLGDGATGSIEFRFRFYVTKTGDDITYGLQTVAISDYFLSASGSNRPVVVDYPLDDFAYGKVYSLKIACIGNYVEASVNGVAIYQRICDINDPFYEHYGTFGISTRRNIAEISIDNVEIAKYNARELSVAPAAASNFDFPTYDNINPSGQKNQIRDKYYIGEHVNFKVTPAAGYELKADSLKYTTADGDTKITDHVGTSLFGFYMPGKSAIVSAEFTAMSFDNDILFSDDFNSESFMTERGWTKNTDIYGGMADLYVGESTFVKYGYNWTDYVAEVDICALDVIEGDTNTDVPSLCVRSQGAKTGYEFSLCFSAGKNVGYYRLYNRATSEIMGSTEAYLLRNKVYRLKVMVEGDNIYCFGDDVLIFKFKDNSYSKGTVGFYSINSPGRYDNLVVRKITAADREAAKAEPSAGPSEGDEKEKESPYTGESLVLCLLAIVSGLLALSVVILHKKRVM